MADWVEGLGNIKWILVVILVALTLTFFGFPSVIREILQQSAAMR